MSGLYSGGTVGGLIISSIARFGDRPAIADETFRWSYRQLGDAISRFIFVFRSIGLKKGDALSILSGNRVETWAAICAATVMGLRYTPLHPLAAEDDALIVEPGKFTARGLAIKARTPSLKHLLSFGSMQGAVDVRLRFRHAAVAPLVDESETDGIV